MSGNARLAKLVPPGEEQTLLRAKDLKNVPLLLKPGQKYKKDDGADGKPWVYVECEVATLDRQGIVEHADNVRIS